MTAKEKAIYALRGNLREARFARLEGRSRKADWHMGLAGQYRASALATLAAPVSPTPSTPATDAQGEKA